MQTTIEQAKIELIQWLAETKDERLLSELLVLKSIQTDDETVVPLSEAQKASIAAGLADIENGRTVPHSEARKIYERWL